MSSSAAEDNRGKSALGDDEYRLSEPELIAVLKTYNREGLLQLIVQASENDPSVTRHIISKSNEDPQAKGRSIYVWNLPHQTTREDLVAVFEWYGEIEHSVVHRRPATDSGQAYRSGFVVFKDVRSAVKALTASKHFVNGSRVKVRHRRQPGVPEEDDDDNEGGDYDDDDGEQHTYYEAAAAAAAAAANVVAVATADAAAAANAAVAATRDAAAVAANAAANAAAVARTFYGNIDSFYNAAVGGGGGGPAGTSYGNPYYYYYLQPQQQLFPTHHFYYPVPAAPAPNQPQPSTAPSNPAPATANQQP